MANVYANWGDDWGLSTFAGGSLNGSQTYAEAMRRYGHSVASNIANKVAAALGISKSSLAQDAGQILLDIGGVMYGGCFQSENGILTSFGLSQVTETISNNASAWISITETTIFEIGQQTQGGSGDYTTFEVLHAGKYWDWFKETYYGDMGPGKSLKVENAVIIRYAENGNVIELSGKRRVTMTTGNRVSVSESWFNPSSNMSSWINDAVIYHFGSDTWPGAMEKYWDFISSDWNWSGFFNWEHFFPKPKAPNPYNGVNR